MRGPGGVTDGAGPRCAASPDRVPADTIRAVAGVKGFGLPY